MKVTSISIDSPRLESSGCGPLVQGRTQSMIWKHGQCFFSLESHSPARLITTIRLNHQRHVFRPYETTQCELRQTPGLICYQCDIVATCIRINDEWRTIPIAECGEGMFCNVRQGGCSDLAGESMSVTWAAADEWAVHSIDVIVFRLLYVVDALIGIVRNILFQGHATVSVI